MLTIHNAKLHLPVVLRRQLFYPSASPILSHALREVAAPILFRTESTAVPAITNVSSPANFSRFFDVDDFFARPFASAFDLHPLFKQFDLLDEQRKDRFFTPGYHFNTDENNFYISLDLPGVRMEDINVELKDDKVLKISGERRFEKDGKISKLFLTKHSSSERNSIRLR